MVQLNEKDGVYLKRLLFIILMVILVGCSPSLNGESNNTLDEIPQMVEVKIKTTPEDILPNKEINIHAHVSQGNEDVDDADEVLFEIWKRGQEEHKKIPGESQGNGIYAVNTNFDEEGIYYIVAHVTARQMHLMPKKELIVGNIDQEFIKDESNIEETEGPHMIRLLTRESIIANKETTLRAIINIDGEPLTNGKVQFEIWKENDKKHNYIDAIEIKNGEYEITTEFNAIGDYNITIHVYKDDLHEHEEKKIVVEE